MKSVICFLIVVGSVVAPIFGAELPPAPITPAIGQAEMAFNREYNEAKAVFDAKVKVAQDKFVALLKNEMKRLTQAGNLDGALAIKDKISSIDTEQIATTKTFAIVEVSSTQITIGKSIKDGVQIASNRQYMFTEVDKTLVGLQYTVGPWAGGDISIKIRGLKSGIVYACIETGSGQTLSGWEKTDLRLNANTKHNWEVWKTFVQVNGELDVPQFGRNVTVVIAEQIQLKSTK